jgi:hypothetical protein
MRGVGNVFHGLEKAANNVPRLGKELREIFQSLETAYPFVSC